MRFCGAGIIGAMIAFAAAPAMAADMVTKAPAYSPVPSWTGFYFGVDAGAALTSFKSTHTGTINSTNFPLGFSGRKEAGGVLAGVHAGYNWQLDPRWLVGVEGEIAWNNTRLESTEHGVVTSTTTSSAIDRLQWLATAAGRLGYLVNANQLFYLKAGAAWTHVESDSTTTTGAGVVTSILSGSNDLLGYTVGAGAEMKILSNWTVRGEYDYVDFGAQSANLSVLLGTTAPVLTGVTVSRDYSAHMHVFKLGVSRYFN